jgi:hypothetical protein
LSNRSTRYCPFCIPNGSPRRKEKAQNRAEETKSKQSDFKKFSSDKHSCSNVEI